MSSYQLSAVGNLPQFDAGTLPSGKPTAAYPSVEPRGGHISARSKRITVTDRELSKDSMWIYDVLRVMAERLDQNELAQNPAKRTLALKAALSMVPPLSQDCSSIFRRTLEQMRAQAYQTALNDSSREHVYTFYDLSTLEHLVSSIEQHNSDRFGLWKCIIENAVTRASAVEGSKHNVQFQYLGASATHKSWGLKGGYAREQQQIQSSHMSVMARYQLNQLRISSEAIEKIYASEDDQPMNMELNATDALPKRINELVGTTIEDWLREDLQVGFEALMNGTKLPEELFYYKVVERHSPSTIQASLELGTTITAAVSLSTKLAKVINRCLARKTVSPQDFREYIVLSGLLEGMRTVLHTHSEEPEAILAEVLYRGNGPCSSREEMKIQAQELLQQMAALCLQQGSYKEWLNAQKIPSANKHLARYTSAFDQVKAIARQFDLPLRAAIPSSSTGLNKTISKRRKSKVRASHRSTRYQGSSKLIPAKTRTKRGNEDRKRKVPVERIDAKKRPKNAYPGYRRK